MEPASRPERDFSLVLGGPLYQLLRRTHLAGDALELVRRRVLVIAGVAWLPLLALAALAGQALGDGTAIAFLKDVEAQVRFLIALPILVAAELLVHLRLRPTVRQFVKRGLIPEREMRKFRAAIESTLRLRNSLIAELVLLAAVYTIGLWVWRSQIVIETASWYAIPDGAGMRFTPAGYWYFLVSLPIFQFILLRWYFRLLLWFWFLWKVAKLDLHLVAMHPDKTCGLSFLGRSTKAFAPVLFAQGAVVAGLIATQIFHAGQSLMDFKLDVAGFVAFVVLVMLVPLMVFAPRLAEAKRAGLAAFGAMASRYVREFEAKWLAGGAAAGESPLGSGDIQSLADLRASYSVVQDMRLIPFTWNDVVSLAATAMAPMLPLALTMFSPEEILGYAIKVLF